MITDVKQRKYVTVHYSTRIKICRGYIALLKIIDSVAQNRSTLADSKVASVMNLKKLFANNFGRNLSCIVVDALSDYSFCRSLVC